MARSQDRGAIVTWRAAWVLLVMWSVTMVIAGGMVGFYCEPMIKAHLQAKPIDAPQEIRLTMPAPHALAFEEEKPQYQPAPKDHPPSVILVGPFHWTVKYVKFGPGEFGRSYPKTLEIQIEPSLPRDQMVETLLHEIIHACLFVGNGGFASMTGEAEGDDLFIEQSIPTFMQVLRDNPELVKWLQEKN